MVTREHLAQVAMAEWRRAVAAIPFYDLMYALDQMRRK